MSLTERIDRFQRRYPASGFPLAVAYKYFDDQGGYLAALITYYGFISLFPLLLIFTTVLDVVLRDNPELQEKILDSALSQIPVIGPQLSEPEQLGGGTVGVVIGIAGAIYGGLGVSVALQNAMNVAWAVPRNDRPDPIRVRIRGALLLSTVGTAIIALTVLNAMAAHVADGTLNRIFTILGSLAITTAVLVVAFRWGTARSVSIRDVLPGAIIAAIGWQILQTFGALYVTRVINRVGNINGVFAVVLGLLAFLYVASVMTVFCLEFNAVRVDKLYPRSLLTPFTDNVELTDGDEAAYTAQARAQRSKGFQEIEVSFDKPADDDKPSDDDKPADGEHHSSSSTRPPGPRHRTGDK